MEQLDELIFGEIKKLSLDPNYIAQLKPKKRKDDRPELIEKRIEEIEQQLSRLMELYSIDGISLESLQKKITELNTNKLRLEQEKTRILLEQERNLSKEDAFKLINSFDAVLERNSMAEIRNILQTLIEKIEIDGDDITIYWKFTWKYVIFCPVFSKNRVFFICTTLVQLLNNFSTTIVQHLYNEQL